MDPELKGKHVVSPKDLLRKKLETGVVAKLTKVETTQLSSAFSSLEDIVDKKAFQDAMLKAGHSIFSGTLPTFVLPNCSPQLSL